MNRQLSLVACFALLLAVGLFLRRGESTPTLAPAGDPPEPGTFPERWIAGNDCDNDPPMQVHAYNDDLYILRQSKCLHYEAPFLYLIFGREKALLIDTGSTSEAPIAQTVMRVVDQWLARNDPDSFELIVAHSHTHGDHYQGDGQFADLPDVTVVGLGHQQVIDFWGFQDYPNDAVTFDLGGRLLDVLGTPGHQASSITIYDRRTQLLLTGDIVYPGHLFIFNNQGWNHFEQSLRRLITFAEENPISWVVGCHIEMTSTPGVPYRYGETQHPDEHVLQLDPRVLVDVHRARLAIGDDPACRVFDDFVIHPVFVCGFPFPF